VDRNGPVKIKQRTDAALGIVQTVPLTRTSSSTCIRTNDIGDHFAAAGGDPAIPAAILGVKREYLEASFEEMQKRYGTIESYFASGLDIDAAGQAALRALLLENKQ
jgi:hypothetical protein